MLLVLFFGGCGGDADGVGVGVLVVMFVEFVTSCCYCLCSHTLHNITVIGGGVTMVPV